MTDYAELLADAARTTANIRRRAAQQAALDLQADTDTGDLDDAAAGLSARRIATLLADAGLLDDMAAELGTGRAMIIAADFPLTDDPPSVDDLVGCFRALVEHMRTPKPGRHKLPTTAEETPMGGKPGGDTVAMVPAEDPLTRALPEDEPVITETVLAQK